jgi:hypothetical protein
MKEPADVTELKFIKSNLEYLENIIPAAGRKWRERYKGKCNEAMKYVAVPTAEERQLLDDLCENSKVITDKIFGNLYRFLNIYIAVREGKKAYTGKALDNLLRLGASAIRKYLIISNFFAERPSFFVPTVEMTDRAKWLETQTQKKKYKDFILTLNQRLIGCLGDSRFPFLKLLDGVKYVPDESIESFKRDKTYLSNMCTLIRTEKLKL